MYIFSTSLWLSIFIIVKLTNETTSCTILPLIFCLSLYNQHLFTQSSNTHQLSVSKIKLDAS